MAILKTTIIASIGTFLIGAASSAPLLALSAKDISSDSVFRSSHARSARAAVVKSSLEHVDSAYSDPDSRGYSPMGTARINGESVAINVFQNGATLGDRAGQGSGVADVFDRAGHLRRRFVYKENLNSPPLITEFVYKPER